MFRRLTLQLRWKWIVAVAALGMLQPLRGTSPRDGSFAATPPETVVDVTSSGAVGDGVTLNTTAIQAAIDSLSRRGGGALRFPAGRYLTGTIELKDNVRLRLSADVTILGSPNPADYRNPDPFTTGSGEHLGYALVTAFDVTNVGIEGPGVIDGQGKAVKAAQKEFKIRPFLVRLVRCKDVTLSDFHLTNPGAWTMVLFQCSNARIDHVVIRSAAGGLPNNDGIDIDSSQGAVITNCDIESGDDAMVLKATSPQPCSDVTITGCTLKTYCNGIKLGTESMGDFVNIHASHCLLHNIGAAGIALYTVDGAQLHDVTMTDLEMNQVTVPISIRLGSRLKTFRPGDKPRPVGTLRDVTLSNIHAVGARQIGLLINGIPGHPVESVHLKNIDISLLGGGTAKDANVRLPEKEAAYPEWNMFGNVMPAFGAYLRHVNGVTCDHVTLSVIHPDARPGVDLLDDQGVTTGDFLIDATAAAAVSEDR
jgi:polygalacturonase